MPSQLIASSISNISTISGAVAADFYIDVYSIDDVLLATYFRSSAGAETFNFVLGLLTPVAIKLKCYTGSSTVTFGWFKLSFTYTDSNALSNEVVLTALEFTTNPTELYLDKFSLLYTDSLLSNPISTYTVLQDEAVAVSELEEPADSDVVDDIVALTEDSDLALYTEVADTITVSERREDESYTEYSEAVFAGDSNDTVGYEETEDFLSFTEDIEYPKAVEYQESLKALDNIDISSLFLDDYILPIEDTFSTGASESTVIELKTTEFDFGNRGIKLISFIEVGLKAPEDTVYVAVEYSHSKQWPFASTAWIPLNSEGVAFINVSGVAFKVKLRVETLNPDLFELDFVNVRWKQLDKRFIRGGYNVNNA